MLQQAVRRSYSALNPGGTILMGFLTWALLLTTMVALVVIGGLFGAP
ncbi:MAG: hypothetical protein Q4C81_02690 [Kocuria sp.]|nr:hypothetical protein [Kocuria sp.]